MGLQQGCFESDEREPWEFYSAKLVRAKKEYRDYETRLPILVGELHYYVAGKYDGVLQTFRFKQDTYELLIRTSCPFGSLKENLQLSDEYEQYKYLWEPINEESIARP